FKHPDRFNGRGEGKWRGQLYGPSLQGLHLGQPIVYRGTFGTALFQCVYQPGPAHWAMLPSTLEWHGLAIAFGMAGLLWPPAWAVAGAMLVFSLMVAGVQAGQAVLPRHHGGLRSRLLIMLLCYVQPLVRSYSRYRTRLFAYSPPPTANENADSLGMPMALTGRHERGYWSEAGHERTQLLQRFLAHLLEHRWGTTVDSGWSCWDMEIYAHPWTRLQLCTVEENHGGTRRLIRARYHLRWTPFARVGGLLGLSACALSAVIHPLAAAAAGGLLIAALVVVWWRGLKLASRAIATLDRIAQDVGLSHCDPTRTRRDDVIVQGLEAGR
ncbi:MAG TPA: hypothetical protein VFA18_19745, partial [Gemmataceae bacterium]|nr:hypothetical protein [Gemmataceae bacterium]